MQRQQRGERTRRAIIEAAALAFERDGFHGANLAEISTRAAVTKGALYFHFSSKEDLAQAVQQEALAAFSEVLRGLLRCDPGGLNALVGATCELAGTLTNSQVARAGLAVADGPGAPDSVLDPWPLWSSTLRRLLTRAHRAGELGGHLDPEVVAGFLTAVSMGIETLSRRERLWLDRGMLADFWALLLPQLESGGGEVSTDSTHHDNKPTSSFVSLPGVAGQRVLKAQSEPPTGG
ncbi:ScbR family autoregulator-binding transcription factor [Streptomyces sp. NPDC006879]|uniref:ScbR family autoregulator-binding transcription factor n=1 Tax=Streptomyces sp. NPDC006879 TaxID=3364767 RepID=UPI0036A989AA